MTFPPEIKRILEHFEKLPKEAGAILARQRNEWTAFTTKALTKRLDAMAATGEDQEDLYQKQLRELRSLQEKHAQEIQEFIDSQEGQRKSKLN